MQGVKLITIIFLLFCSCEEKKSPAKQTVLGETSGFKELKSDSTQTPLPSTVTNKTEAQVSTVGVEELEANRLESIEISPGNSEIPVSFNLSLKAVAIFKNGSKMIISNKAKWTSLQPDIANFPDSAQPEKLRTIALGKVNIQVEYEKITVNVTYEVKNAVLERIEITPKTILVGTTQKLYATALYSDKTTRDVTDDVTWNITQQNNAEIVENTKIKGNSPGNISVKAIYNGQEGGAGLIEIRLKKLNTIEIKYQTNVLVLGSSLEWKAEGIFEDDSREDITNIVKWTSSNPEIATVASNSNIAGRIHGVKNGKSVIKVELNSISEELQLEVIIANFTGIVLEPDVNKIPLGYTEQFKLMGILENGNKQDITENAIWMSLDTEFATVSNMQGQIGQVKALSKGTVTLKVTYGEFTIEKNVLISNPAVQSLEFDPLMNPYKCGIDTPTLKVTGVYTDGTKSNLSNLVTWESKNEERATVSNAEIDKGKITSYQVGEVTLKATYVDPVLARSVVGEISFNSDSPQILGGIIQASANPIPIGVSLQLLYLLDYSCGENVDKTAEATFESPAAINEGTAPNNTVIDVQVSNATAMKGVVITSGRTPNSRNVMISASYQGFEAEFELTIITQQIISTIIQAASGHSLTFNVGATSQLVASGLYTNGDMIDYTTTANWVSNDPVNVAVNNTDQKGLVMGLKEDRPSVSATISTDYGIFVGSKELRVESVCPSDGKRNFLFCYFITTKGENCTNYCANRGVTVHSRGMNHAHNNMGEACNDIINAFGHNVEMNVETTFTKGLGCSLYETEQKFLFKTPTMNYDDSHPNFSRICSCNHNPF